MGGKICIILMAEANRGVDKKGGEIAVEKIDDKAYRDMIYK